MPLNVPTDPANIAGRPAPTGQAPPPYFTQGPGPIVPGAPPPQFNSPPMGVRNAPQQQDQGQNMAYLAFQAFAKAHQQHQKMMSAIAQGVSNAPQQATTSEPGRGERGEIIPGATSSGTTSPTGQGPQNFPGNFPYDSSIEPDPIDQNPWGGFTTGVGGSRTGQGIPGQFTSPFGTNYSFSGPSGQWTNPQGIPRAQAVNPGQDPYGLSGGFGTYGTGGSGPGFGGASAAFGGGPPGSLYFAHPELQG